MIASNELSQVNRRPKLCHVPQTMGAKARVIAVIPERNGAAGVRIEAQIFTV